jgi:hypothetical protein
MKPIYSLPLVLAAIAATAACGRDRPRQDAPAETTITSSPVTATDATVTDDHHERDDAVQRGRMGDDMDRSGAGTTTTTGADLERERERDLELGRERDLQHPPLGAGTGDAGLQPGWGFPMTGDAGIDD